LFTNFNSIRQREASGELADFPADFFQTRGVIATVQRVVDQVRDIEHLFFFHPARGHGGRADANAAGFEDGCVERDAVLVYGDAGVVEQR
jgi:hypothetical protein